MRNRRYGGNGVVDMFDWGPPDGKAVVYEVEPDYTPERKRQKGEQYSNWIIQDVIVLDPTEALGSVNELWRWLTRSVSRYIRPKHRSQRCRSVRGGNESGRDVTARRRTDAPR